MESLPFSFFVKRFDPLKTESSIDASNKFCSFYNNLKIKIIK